MVKTFRSLSEAIATKNAMALLNKKLGIRKMPKIKRTRDLRFEVFE